MRHLYVVIQSGWVGQEAHQQEAVRLHMLVDVLVLSIKGFWAHLGVVAPPGSGLCPLPTPLCCFFASASYALPAFFGCAACWHFWHAPLIVGWGTGWREWRAGWRGCTTDSGTKGLARDSGTEGIAGCSKKGRGKRVHQWVNGLVCL